MGALKEHKSQITGSGWVPLSQAIFECFWKDELENGANQIHLQYRSQFAPRTLAINTTAQTLRLVLSDGSVFEGPPWEFLSITERLPGNAVAAALLHKCVGEVWSAMNDAFGKKVSSSTVSLFARMDDFRAEFVPIPSDHWSFYKVTDWKNGAAIARDGRVIFSIHAKFANVTGSGSAGRRPTYDQDQVNGEVKRRIKEKGVPGRDRESGWQSEADLQAAVADFLRNTTGKIPVKSTLQRLVKNALNELKSENR
jgi:hypothetical protein